MKNYEYLNNLKVEISQSTYEAQILFETIESYKISTRVCVAAQLGEKICKQIRKNCEQLEFALDEIRNKLQ